MSDSTPAPIVSILHIKALIRVLLDETFAENRDITHPEWLTFWSEAAATACFFQLTSTPRDLADALDTVWAQLVGERRPTRGLNNLHRLILVTAGVSEEDSYVFSLLAFFQEHITLPDLHDRRANLILLTTLDDLRAAFVQDDMAKVRATMTRYVDLLAPEPGPVTTSTH